MADRSFRDRGCSIARSHPLRLHLGRSHDPVDRRPRARGTASPQYGRSRRARAGTPPFAHPAERCFPPTRTCEWSPASRPKPAAPCRRADGRSTLGGCRRRASTRPRCPCVERASPQGALRWTKPVSTNPHDPWGNTILAQLTILEEEVDASLGPAHPTMTFDQPALPAMPPLKLSQQHIEAIELGSSLAHGFLSSARE